MENNKNNVPFSPILIMEFIRQTTVARFLNSEVTPKAVKFKLPKTYYDEIMAFPIKAQRIMLPWNYDETTEILQVSADEKLVNQFRNQKSLTDIAGKYEEQYKERYKSYVEVLE